VFPPVPNEKGLPQKPAERFFPLLWGDVYFNETTRKFQKYFLTHFVSGSSLFIAGSMIFMVVAVAHDRFIN